MPMMSSVEPSARRRSISSTHMVANSPPASAARSSTGSSASVWPSPAIMASLQRYRSWRWSGSRPISSAITMSGTWMAMSPTKSQAPFAEISSMIWLDRSRM
jgi:hypothetical protein